ncbi:MULTISPECIES: divergent PAP2 family protein [Exiguobacterium]|uniref:divergent PAP2 family protein n=1 Tax=Exiguobacterium TaxID=33986 RepID=UPI001BE6BBF8|nr:MULTISPECIES: divergent PAP2 family protein [Exiguobacterium]MCT4782944.1 divergent PAP2 family protein [Exiguobacterium himgiriensis]
MLFNEPLLAALLAWFIAQAAKLVTELIKTRDFELQIMFASGGMPSSHSSTVVALATVIGRMEGLDSSMFALALIFATIVMYDATGVRQAVGFQARLLNDYFKGIKHETPILNELVGHTPFQVIVGALLGLVVGFFFPI